MRPYLLPGLYLAAVLGFGCHDVSVDVLLATITYTPSNMYTAAERIQSINSIRQVLVCTRYVCLSQYGVFRSCLWCTHFRLTIASTYKLTVPHHVAFAPIFSYPTLARPPLQLIIIFLFKRCTVFPTSVASIPKREGCHRSKEWPPRRCRYRCHYNTIQVFTRIMGLESPDSQDESTYECTAKSRL